MNERWKYMINQAIREIGPEDKPSKEETLKRYAELIVRECANVAWKCGSEFIDNQIKEHFGVEE